MLKDLGLAKAGLASWFGLAAPPGTPMDIIEKLNKAFVAAAKEPAVRQKIEDSGLTVVTTTPAVMQKLMISDTNDVVNLIRALGLKKE